MTPLPSAHGIEIKHSNQNQRLTYIQGDCSYSCAEGEEEKEEIQRRSNGCFELPPCPAHMVFEAVNVPSPVAVTTTDPIPPPKALLTHIPCSG